MPHISGQSPKSNSAPRATESTVAAHELAGGRTAPISTLDTAIFPSRITGSTLLETCALTSGFASDRKTPFLSAMAHDALLVWQWASSFFLVGSTILGGILVVAAGEALVKANWPLAGICLGSGLASFALTAGFWALARVCNNLRHRLVASSADRSAEPGIRSAAQ